jgi:hypothetical protein
MQLGEICAALEQAGRDDDSRAQDHARLLEAALEAVIGAMQGARDAGNPPEHGDTPQPG